MHRPTGPGVAADEVAARAWENRRDADAFRVLFYAGVRVGELVALRLADVDLADRMLIIRRTLSANQETLPTGGHARWVPLSQPAHDALDRLLDRDDFTAPDDYVIINRLGRRVDPSALRRRYKLACEKAGLRPVKLHGLRHAAGSLVARTSDPVFVSDFLGHSKLSTGKSLAGDDIVLHRLPSPGSAARAAIAMREHLESAVRHPAGTTDRLLKPDRNRPY